MKPSQYQLCQEAAKKANARDVAIMEMINDPINPMTKADLKRLIEKFPERYARYAGMIDKLKD